MFAQVREKPDYQQVQYHKKSVSEVIQLSLAYKVHFRHRNSILLFYSQSYLLGYVIKSMK